MSRSPISPFVVATLDNCLRGIDAALRAGNSAAALQLGAEGARRGYAHPLILLLATQERLAAGDAQAALAWAEEARDAAPHNPDILNVLGHALTANGRAREALRAYDAALRKVPNGAMIRFNKAEALESLNELGLARREYERVLDVEPNHTQALAHLANLAALSGDAAAARAYGARALKVNPGEAAAQLALATADLEDKNFMEAHARAEAVVKDAGATAVNRSIAQGIIGDALEGEGRHGEAFAAYTASNAARRAAFQSAYEQPGVETAPERLARLTDYFRNADPAKWRADATQPLSKPSPKSKLETHVFLIGFPRSGTTLLEQILASHGGVETMEERDCLAKAFEDFVLAEGGLDRLATLTGSALDPWRKAYWQAASQAGFAPSAPVFIDKMPLNSVLLPLIAKLFPNAKLLFALRDPRDVVLSCFRRRFGMSAQMYQFLTLDGAACYYDGVMALVGLYRDLLGLDTHSLRYEDMVGDFEGETREVCAFLGLDWDEGMRDFAARTRARNVGTPSAAQVARGLYTKGRGQWRGFAQQMNPVLPLLAPWCAAFGYEEE